MSKFIHKSNKPDSPLSDNRNHAVDVLKGVSILMVLINHYVWTESERLTLLFPFWVDVAVPVFMAISGFLYSKSYLKHNINRFCEPYRFKELFRHALRFVIPYSIIFIVEVAVIISIKVDIKAKDFLYLFFSGGIGVGGYYFPVMLQFLLIFPVIYFLIAKYDLQGLMICGGINLLYEITQKLCGADEKLYELIMLRYVFIVAIGCYIAIGKKTLNNIYLYSAAAIGIVYIINVKYLHVPYLSPYRWSGTSMFGSLYILPLLFWTLESKIRCKPIELLGKASYNIFLFQMVYYLFIGPKYKYLPGTALRLFINFIICCTAGVIFYYLESPLTKRLTKLLFDTKNSPETDYDN